MRGFARSFKRAEAGYVSYVMVLSLGMVMIAMMVHSFRSSMEASETQGEVMLRVDYQNREDAILRAIIPIAANRAMQCMQHQSNSDNYELRWQRIFRAAIDRAMGSDSVDDSVLREFALEAATVANPGDASIFSARTFWSLDGTNANGYTTPGINQEFGAAFPPPLETGDRDVIDRDSDWPIISYQKKYGTRASGRVGAPVDEFPQFNVLPYPEIRFGYAEPGEPFVAKRNWWAFKMDLAAHQRDLTEVSTTARDFVISIYEVPSQLAISAEAFTVLGEHADGSQWENFTIQGGVFSSRTKVGSGMALERVSGRHDIEIAPDATVGNQALFEPNSGNSDPFAPGVRESYELKTGDFMPVSLASESGRAAFVPINRGPDFFDRYAHTPESNAVSPTTWDEYTIGAMQCAMHLDITETPDETNPMPSELTFEYYDGGQRREMILDLENGPEAGLPPGYIYCCNENQTVEFDHPVDVAYGKGGNFYFQEGVSGSVTFNNARFGDPYVGTFKAGYYRPSYPFEVVMLRDLKPCIALYPQRFEKFLDLIGADDPEVNHSISINVDYPGSSHLAKPAIPCTDLDYGVLLKECADFTDFPKGFSLVTNLRLYIADDFNTTETTVPPGSGLPTPFYPPCSLFAPEQRYGGETDPFALSLSGQMGSLKGGREDSAASVHLLDLKTSAERDVEHDKIQVNLAPIRHPAALPPVMMTNWLVVIEERRDELYSQN
jgi:hypothetical protein